MFTTRSRSGNSKRCGVSASRSFGPMSGSVLIIVNALSITSRHSPAELKPMPEPYAELPLHERVTALRDVLVNLALDDPPNELRELEDDGAVRSVPRAERGEVDRVAELEP